MWSLNKCNKTAKKGIISYKSCLRSAVFILNDSDLLNKGKMKGINIPEWLKPEPDVKKIHTLCSASYWKKIYTSSLMRWIKLIYIIRTLNITFNKTCIF